MLYGYPFNFQKGLKLLFEVEDEEGDHIDADTDSDIGTDDEELEN